MQEKKEKVINNLIHHFIDGEGHSLCGAGEVCCRKNDLLSRPSAILIRAYKAVSQGREVACAFPGLSLISNVLKGYICNKNM